MRPSLGDRVVFWPGTRVAPPQEHGTVAGVNEKGELWVRWAGGDLTWEPEANLQLDEENPWPEEDLPPRKRGPLPDPLPENVQRVVDRVSEDLGLAPPAGEKKKEKDGPS